MTELGVIEALKFFVILGFIDIVCFIIIEIKDRRKNDKTNRGINNKKEC